MAASVVSAAKKALRNRIYAQLSAMTSEDRASQSESVAKALFELHQFKNARSITVFLSMPSAEIDTRPILMHAFEHGKRVFVPRVMDAKSCEMHMFEAKSLADIDMNFELSKWKIPEPPLASLYDRANVLDTNDLDLVIAPGVAFDLHCHRLGHGKGFYDRWFKLIQSTFAARNQPSPFLLGIGLAPQFISSDFKSPAPANVASSSATELKSSSVVVDGNPDCLIQHVPVHEFDVPLDAILVPNLFLQRLS